MNREKITIEVWSDIVCPYCYLGKRKLHQAIHRLHASDRIDIIWRSYQLDPGFPENTSISSLQYLSQRKGYPVAHIRGMHQQLSERGRRYGIRFQFETSLSFNTLDAHRLWQWSRSSGKSDALKEAFFSAYFTDGVDLSKNENLLEVVEMAGLDKAEAGRILVSGAYSDAVELDVCFARQLGIRSVPYFLINEKKAISGAQDDRVFEEAISVYLSN